MTSLFALGFLESLFWTVGGLVLAILLLIITMIIRCWRKVEQGTALIVTGGSQPTVHFSKAIVWPLIRQADTMDISVKRIEIFRHGTEGLVCKDNVRADIKVAFFVRVNNTEADVLKVAQSIGVKRASQQQSLVELFDAKFSEALKTVGKHFDFVELYTSRDEFKEQILKIIGRDLNGYVLDDAAIDYLEQTPLDSLDPHNILDSEGIKKITDLTAQQQVLANNITRKRKRRSKSRTSKPGKPSWSWNASRPRPKRSRSVKSRSSPRVKRPNRIRSNRKSDSRPNEHASPPKKKWPSPKKTKPGR